MTCVSEIPWRFERICGMSAVFADNTSHAPRLHWCICVCICWCVHVHQSKWYTSVHVCPYIHRHLPCTCLQHYGNHQLDFTTSASTCPHPTPGHTPILSPSLPPSSPLSLFLSLPPSLSLNLSFTLSLSLSFPLIYRTHLSVVATSCCN